MDEIYKTEYMQMVKNKAVKEATDIEEDSEDTEVSDEKAAEYADAADRIEEIAGEMQDLVREVKGLVKTYAPVKLGYWDRYVFEGIREHIFKSNKYNADLQDIADHFRLAAGEEVDDRG